MKRVVIESPFRGDRVKNSTYAFQCLSDSIDRGEAPFASHLLYPFVLNDEIREERNKGIVCGYQWMEVCDLVAFYIDLGMSAGMALALQRAKDLGKPYELRNIYEETDSEGIKQPDGRSHEPDQSP